jgi:hypothetical protein
MVTSVTELNTVSKETSATNGNQKINSKVGNHGLLVKYPSGLSDFNQKWNVSSYFNKVSNTENHEIPSSVGLCYSKLTVKRKDGMRKGKSDRIKGSHFSHLINEG